MTSISSMDIASDTMGNNAEARIDAAEDGNQAQKSPCHYQMPGAVEVLSTLEAERAETLPNFKLRSLSPTRITTVPDLFQPRAQDGVDELHVNDLVDALKRGARLDPVVVIEVKGKFVTVDGHHRLAAFKRVRAKKVPVVPFRGTVREAMATAGGENGKARLQMTKSDRQEYAWRLVCMGAGEWSKREITAMAQVSDGQVGRMRRRWRELDRPSVEDREPWWQSRGTLAELEKMPDDEREAWVQEQVDEMAERIGKATGGRLGDNPEVSARAIAKVAGGRLEALLSALAEEFPAYADYAKLVQNELWEDELSPF